MLKHRYLRLILPAALVTLFIASTLLILQVTAAYSKDADESRLEQEMALEAERRGPLGAEPLPAFPQNTI